MDSISVAEPSQVGALLHYLTPVRSVLTYDLAIRIIYLTSLLFGAGLGFHAEWLRDEP